MIAADAAPQGMAYCPHPECRGTLLVQRTVNGTLQDGMNQHYRFVHPGEAEPLVS